MYPPFIATQRLWRLVCPPAFQQECLRPEKIWTLPREGADPNVQPIDVPGLPPGRCRWERILDREAFLADLAILRLGITIDAGVGKTTALRQAQYLRQIGGNRDGLAMFVEFAELPDSPDRYLGSQREALLIRKLRNSQQTRNADPSGLLSLIERKMRCGQFTLLVDALDQSAPLVGSEFQPRAACQALCDFLQRYPEVRCVVSSRPFAIQSYWKPLFQPDGSWEFVKVDLFTRDESEFSVGAPRLALLSRLGADVMAIPRSLEMIQQIADDDLSGLRTKSDVYWRSLIGMLTQALANQAPHVGLPEPEAIYLFALVAFEMSHCGFRANLAGISSRDRLSRFLHQICKSRKRELQEYFCLENDDVSELKNKLDEKLSRLLAVNDNLADPVLAGSAGPTVVQLLWRNQTLLDMYAALWLTRHARSEKDRAWFREQVGVAARKELYQLAVEMPRDQRAREDVEVFPNLVAFLFSSSHDRASRPTWRRMLDFATRLLGRTGQHERRWTELIYRGWPQLLEIAGYPRTRVADNGDALPWKELVRRGTVEAQREVRQRVETGASLVDPSNRARELVWEFLGEYPRILQGARGASAQRIAVEFEEGFRKIPKMDGESLTFPMGAEPGEPGRSVTIPGPFELSRYAVTNELYALFDAGHMSCHSDYRQYSPGPQCPVIYVDWYGAWCCSLWLGGYLPSEEEWEYACRAGSTGAYCFDGDENQLGSYAWYDANAGGHAHPVGQKLPNTWGLYDMHGNVLEWCDSWEDETARARVLRGGSWIRDGGSCRSGFRSRRTAGYRDGDYGFRLAAVPGRASQFRSPSRRSSGA